MKKIYSKGRMFRFLLIGYLWLMSLHVTGQENVIWTYTAPPNITQVIGTYNSGAQQVIAASVGTGWDMHFLTDPDTDMFSDVSILETRGPMSNAPSKQLKFTFPEKVIITAFKVQNIDYSPTYGGGYNDSFDVLGAGFSSVAPNNATSVTVNGVRTGPTDNAPATVIWRCSQPTDSLRINYVETDLHKTHAWLFYQIELLRLPVINPLCMNSIAPELPATLGNGITGNWNPATINTSTAGTFEYVFTPNTGQAISCPVSIDVIVQPAQLTLASALDDCTNLSPDAVKHKSTSDWIKATNVIGFGDNVYQNGVVYHAANFIELNPGFEAIFSSQFSAYIEECSVAYNYKQQSITEDFSGIENPDNKVRVYPNPSNRIIYISYKEPLKSIKVLSMDGKTVINQIAEHNTQEIDVSALKKGIYMIAIETQNGQFLQSKFIKN